MKEYCFSLLASSILVISCSTGIQKKEPEAESAISKTLVDNEPNDITGNFYLPPLAYPGDEGYIKGELLYPLNNKPTPECHSSTIVETPSGLVCAFFAGSHEGNPDVGIRVSRLVDEKWSWPAEVTNGVQSGNLRFPCWNPVLFLAKNGPLMLFYKVGPSPNEWWGMIMTSQDDGQTWSTPAKLGEDPKVGHLLGPVKNKPVQLVDGTIICPSSTEVVGEDMDIKWRVHFELTSDRGQTWEVVGPINDGITFDAIQPTILTYLYGTMQVLCRTREGVISQSWSDNQGRSWSTMIATRLPNPNAGIDGVTLKDGRQLLVYNHTTKQGKTQSGRYLLNVAISNNRSEWTQALTLEDNIQNNAGYSYPAVIQTQDSLVHITYTYERVSIKHVVLDPAIL